MCVYIYKNNDHELYLVPSQINFRTCTYFCSYTKYHNRSSHKQQV